MADEQYDPDLHITAGELRAAGLDITESIPDVAWVPRDAFRWEVGGSDVEPDSNRVEVDVTIRITEPFRWYRVQVTFTEKTDG